MDELKNALKVSLANRGVLDDIKARIRAEVFSVIESEADERKPDPPREVFLINELIRDYLEFQGYKHTLSVFLPETGQPEHRCDSSLLARELSVPAGAASAADMPLLYVILAQLANSTVSARGDPSAPTTAAAGRDTGSSHTPGTPASDTAQNAGSNAVEQVHGVEVGTPIELQSA